MQQQFVILHQGHKLSVAADVRSAGSEWIILLHGLGSGKTCFAAVFDEPRLASYSLCAFDFPGHGQSDKPDWFGYRLEDFAEITKQITAQLHGTKIHFVAHSMGGGIGVVAAQNMPELGWFISLEGLLGGGAFSRKITSEDEPTFVRSGYQKFLANLYQSDNPSLRTYADEFARANPTAVYRSAVSMVEWANSGTLFTALAALPHKLYIHGDTNNADELHRRYPDVPSHYIADSGHFLMLDKPHELYGVIAEQLAT